MYGFHKIPHIEDNAFSKSESQVWEFSNSNFHRDQPDLLCLVTRKKSGETGDKDSLDYQTIMGEIQAIKRHQMTISQDLKRIQADNQALWQEQIDTRTRHSKHQETIDKILAFLGSVYGNQRQDEKSIRPKKRKLLLQNDSSDQIQTLESIFDDDRTKETFDNMFKSASPSPNLRPLRQPATDIGSSKLGGPGGSESRFTLPNFEARQQSASGPSHPHQIRNMNKMKNSPAPTVSPPLTSSSPIEKQTRLSQPSTPSRQPVPIDTTEQSLATLDPTDPMNPLNMQLTPSIQNRISSNNGKAAEIEQDLAQQDQNIEALASLLGLDPGDLDTSTLDPTIMTDMCYDNFDDFLNQSASVTATPQSTNGFDTFGGGGGGDGSDINSNFGGGIETPSMINRMPPPATTVPNGSQHGTGTPVTGAGRITSADSTPGSTAGSVHEEEIEEIDMDKARGKKRKSTG